MEIDYPLPPNVVKAVLTEDLIDTIRATKGPYLRARVAGYHNPIDDLKCPLVHIESPYFILSMKKGDAIMVEIPSDAFGSLRLWGLDSDLPGSLLAELAMPSSGTIVTAPAAYDTFSFQYFSPGFYVISGDEITTVVSGGVQTIYTPKSVLTFCASDGEYSVKTNRLNFEAQGPVKFLVNGVSMKSRSVELKDILDNIYAQISDIYSAFGAHTHIVSTAGTAVAQTGTADPTMIPLETEALLAAITAEKAATTAEFFRLS